MQALEVVPGESREALSVPLQQIARSVAHHDGDLSDDEKAVIAEILPYDSIEELYNPQLSDPIKAALDEATLKSDPLKYASCWFALGVQHPKTYLESFLANAYGYWYPETLYWQISTESYFTTMEYAHEAWGWPLLDYEPEKYLAVFGGYNENTDRVDKLYSIVRSIPGVSMLCSVAIYFWISALLVIACLYKRNYKLIVPFSIVAAVFITCLISPVHAECLYAYYAILACPVLVSYVLQNLIKQNEMGLVDR